MTGHSREDRPFLLHQPEPTPSFCPLACVSTLASPWETPSVLSVPPGTTGNESQWALKFNKKINEWGVPETGWMRSGNWRERESWSRCPRTEDREERSRRMGKQILNLRPLLCVSVQRWIRETRTMCDEGFSWNQNSNTDQLADNLNAKPLSPFWTMTCGHRAHKHSQNTHSNTICLCMCLCVFVCACVCVHKDSHIDPFLLPPDTITLMPWMEGQTFQTCHMSGLLANH